MIEINLIPDVKREYLKTKSLRNLVITTSVIVGAGTIALAVALGIIFSGQLVLEMVRSNNIKSEGAKLVAIEDLNKTVTIQQQLSKIDSQQASKSMNSRLFDVMAAINPPAPNDIKISLLKMDPEAETVTIEGSAANGYMALEVFKKTISNTKVQFTVDGVTEDYPLATDITTGDTSFGEDASGSRVLRFAFTFTYPSELFMISDNPVPLITPSGRVNVTDSKLGVPESLFGKKADDLEEE